TRCYRDWSSDVCSSDLIHQIMQKVEGNVSFHTAMATAFPQPVPGTAPSAGPLAVPADELRHVLGITNVNYMAGGHHLAVVDASRSEERRVGIECVSGLW